MTQQEFSDLFNVYCTFDIDGVQKWFTHKPYRDMSLWYTDNLYIMSQGVIPPSVERKQGDWKKSLTCPRWIPKDNEAIAVYNTDDTFFNIVANTYQYYPWENVAKYSGQLDLRVETIRNEPHYKKDGKLVDNSD